MTLEQLAIFVAVAEREHVTQAAAALHLTPSAVSSAIRSLEAYYDVQLFDRVGRGIELTRNGRLFLREARETLARARAAEAALMELGSLQKGTLDIHASQTIANHWLPPRLLRFVERHPGLTVNLSVGNTETVAAAVLGGEAELGFIEGAIDEPKLAATPFMQDKLVVVISSAGNPEPQTMEPADLLGLKWIMREEGSGTRRMFKDALGMLGIDHAALRVALTLPSNEGVLAAVRSGGHATALSESVVAPFVENGQLSVLAVDLHPRQFTILRHKERRLSAAAKALETLCHASATTR